MAGAWDSMAKRLIGANPEHFIKWLASEATFVAVLDLELKSKHLYADALLQITQDDKPGLLHIEVQAYRDPEMQVRLLEYNVLASRQYSHIPVYSYVICLLEVADVVDPPFTRRFLKWRGSTSLLLSSNQVMWIFQPRRFCTQVGQDYCPWYH